MMLLPCAKIMMKAKMNAKHVVVDTFISQIVLGSNMHKKMIMKKLINFMQVNANASCPLINIKLIDVKFIKTLKKKWIKSEKRRQILSSIVVSELTAITTGIPQS